MKRWIMGQQYNHSRAAGGNANAQGGKMYLELAGFTGKEMDKDYLRSLQVIVWTPALSLS